VEDEPKDGPLRPSSPASPRSTQGSGGDRGSDPGPCRDSESSGKEAPRRASVFPSIAPPPGPNYRIVFALLWVAIQAVLIVTAGRRSDGAFGFRMFSESSTLELAMFREIEGADGRPTLVHVDGGVWTARGSDGAHHRLTWYDRVPTPYWVFDQEMHASYGASAQLERLKRALDDVAAHLASADDVETRRLVLEVKVRRNGREPVLHRLASIERALPDAARSEAARADSGDGGP